eukprot:CAMPEP_0168541976 /NCGR_PEP_ID=MMETSP0413-20121227/1102_1 /TAXON_ID=136452 /ORGANISM="Filamoeba nolandi, Strain NC-AS-23-1" /LENGTH=244 /DNA_ID=CAMNT_0008571823 /DNA_START=82 /DNA_END=813 /DNA_ORIENTATION=-
MENNNKEEIVRLNIGGSRFYTTHDTLTRCSGDESFFAKLLSGKFAITKDEKGFIFVDRDGKLFEPILSYLRTGNWVVPKDVDAKQLLQEADFYGIHVQRSVSDSSLGDIIKQAKDTHAENVLSKYPTEVEDLKTLVFAAFLKCAEEQKPIKTPYFVSTEKELIWKNFRAIPWSNSKVDMPARRNGGREIESLIKCQCQYGVTFLAGPLSNPDFVGAFVRHLKEDFDLTVSSQTKCLNVQQSQNW